MRKLLFVLSLLAASGAHAADPAAAPAPEQKTEAAAPAVNPADAHITALDVAMGDEKATVTLIEYASLSCKHCAVFEATAFPVLKEKYIDTGKIKFIVRNFPFDATALQGALLAHCVPKDKYYDVMHTLFSEQDKWVLDHDPAARLAAYGKQYGLTQQQVDACLQDKELKEKIATVASESKRRYAISSTPSFLLNGQRTETLRSMDHLSGKIDALLEKKP
jgi:protein-disulfide isomerase